MGYFDDEKIRVIGELYTNRDHKFAYKITFEGGSTAAHGWFSTKEFAMTKAKSLAKGIDATISWKRGT